MEGYDLYPLLLTPGGAHPLWSGQSWPSAEVTSEGPNMILLFMPWVRLFTSKTFTDPTKDECFLLLSS